MKHVFACSLLLLSLFGHSQGFFKGISQRLSFGLTAGGNYSNFTSTDNLFTTDGMAGYHAGAFVDFKLLPNFYFHEEFLYSVQGAKIKTDPNDLIGKDKVQISYLSVPCLFQYRTKLGFFIEAGTNSSVRLTDNLDQNRYDHKFAKQLDMGVLGGIGYRSPLGIGIDIRYGQGLTKVANFEVDGTQPKFTNSMAQASIFYIF